MNDFDQILDRTNKIISECIDLMARTKFGLSVSAARRRRKMTQIEACKKMGVSRETLSELERGIRVPKQKTVMELQKLFPEVFT